MSQSIRDGSEDRKRPSNGPLMGALPLLWRVPGVNERLAAHFFLTPFGRLRDEERTPPSTSGEEVVLQTRSRVVCRTFGEGDPVFVVHGWGGCGLQMSGFVGPLVERGHRAVVLDLPAHGDSDGKLTNALDCSNALLAAQRRFGSPSGVIAHSFGAAATVLAMQRGMSVGALVFVAPLPSLDVGVKQFAERARLPVAVMDRASRRIVADLGLDRRMIDLSAVGPWLRTPLLCIHDQDDTVIDIDETRRVVERWPDARLIETEGLGHRALLRSDLVTSHAAAFLAQGLRDRRSDLDLFLNELAE